MVTAVPTVDETSASSPVRSREPGGIVDVPDISAAWYRAILARAHDLPDWVGHAAVLFTDGVLVVFALALLLALRYALGRDDRTLSRALLAPPVTVLAYLVSEAAKTVKDVARPCRTSPRSPTARRRATSRCPATTRRSRGPSWWASCSPGDGRGW